jgi:hypothetical protein
MGNSSNPTTAYKASENTKQSRHTRKDRVFFIKMESLRSDFVESSAAEAQSGYCRVNAGSINAGIN